MPLFLLGVIFVALFIPQSNRTFRCCFFLKKMIFRCCCPRSTELERRAAVDGASDGRDGGAARRSRPPVSSSGRARPRCVVGAPGTGLGRLARCRPHQLGAAEQRAPGRRPLEIPHVAIGLLLQPARSLLGLEELFGGLTSPAQPSLMKRGSSSISMWPVRTRPKFCFCR